MQVDKFTYTVKSEAKCKGFLKIKKQGEMYTSIDAFIQKYPKLSEKELNDCYIEYRGREQSYKQMADEYTNFSNTMKFVQFIPPQFIIEADIRASIYFTQKAIECLQFARFFTMKSALLLDIDYNVRWAQGYFPQFLFRCIYFGTATTWYSNAFDHVLQLVYWGEKIYTAAFDKNGDPYREDWEPKKIMKCCTYKVVVGELKKQNQVELRKLLTSCSSKIEEVRKWANYIKHKGGIDYKYLDPEKPFEVYYVPQTGIRPKDAMQDFQLPDEKYKLEDFKSPVEIDIDEKLNELVNAHNAIYECIVKVIDYMNFPHYSIGFGGNT